MSTFTKEQIVDLVSASVEALTRDLQGKINELTRQFEGLTPKVDQYDPVTLARFSKGTSLDLVKSLPEFKGDGQTYPAWRETAYFGMNYYTEGTENYYVAMGIFRNKITGAANAKLSAFNAVLNFKAIIARLDQCYADKRSLQALENELSILRQGNKSISDFYDTVDEHLTLIVNKNKMSYSNNEDIANALNERARDNALRVFISGLRRPLSDILFSARPADLPTALATAQELESDQKRQEFARIFAAGDTAKTNYTPQKKTTNFQPTHPSYKYAHPAAPKDTVKPMDVDPGSSMFRRSTLHSSPQKNPQHDGNKRKFEDSGRTAPIPKAQRDNYIDSEEVEDYEEVSSIFEGDLDEDEGVEQLNFLILVHQGTSSDHCVVCGG